MTEHIDATENMISKFAAATEIPYDLRFSIFALNWVTGLTGLAGGVQKESDALLLAIDETLSFIIDSYPNAEPMERIRLELVLQSNDTVEISITNAGPPLHPSRIPQYNPQNPSESDLDGLWYFLARKTVDDLTFENHGRDGWRVLIRKRLAAVSFEAKAPTGNTIGSSPARKTPFITRLAVPDDAPALVDLTYDTYRYSYPGESFYHESELRKALGKGEIISMVVEADGVIVGNSSFVISQQMPRCAYSCSLMIKPAFRQSQAIIYLLREIDNRLNSGSLDVDLSYGNTVTTHTGSQKAGARIGYKPLALLLSACIAVDFRGMKMASTERETFVVCVRFTTTPTLQVIYLPERHHAVMTGLLEQVGLHVRISAEATIAVAEHATFSIEENAGECSATIVITEWGKDWTERLQKNIFALKSKGIQTIIIFIPAWRPIPPDIDREMGRFNAIFTGLQPVSASECHLVYCALPGPVNFEQIRLMDPLAEELKEHCHRLYEEIFAG